VPKLVDRSSRPAIVRVKQKCRYIYNCLISHAFVTFRPLLLTAELIWAPLAPGLWVLKLVLVFMPANFIIHLGRTVVLQNQRSGFAEGLLRITQACTNYSHQFSH